LTVVRQVPNILTIHQVMTKWLAGYDLTFNVRPWLYEWRTYRANSSAVLTTKMFNPFLWPWPLN
jgi:hypothetical protein